MGTKNKPGSFDCYHAAEPDEPMFVLLARDPIAPLLVDLWAHLRSKTRGMSSKVMEAKSCFQAMLAWLGDRDELDKVEDVKMALSSIYNPEGGEYTFVSRKELESLREDSHKLLKLEGAGVDSWEGYEEAMRDVSEDDSDQNDPGDEHRD